MSIDYATKNRWQNRVRWWAAWKLNHMPRTCWANLVSWALHSRPLFDRFGDGDIRRTSMCFEPGQERCYCGKFANPLEPIAALPNERTSL